MFRRIIFQAHWLIGVSAGVVLAVVGFTGGLLSFESEALDWLNRNTRTVPVRAQAPLAPAELLERVRAQLPGQWISSITVTNRLGAATRITLQNPGDARSAESAAPRRGNRNETRYVNPYDGGLLAVDANRGQAFFRTVRQLHRGLTVGEFGNQQVGKQIVAASTLFCAVLALSGLYLRWPKRVGDWRAWFKIDFALKGRAFLWQLHAVAGACCLIVYLMAAFTGLYWSYSWYREGLYALTGVDAPPARNEAVRRNREARAEGESWTTDQVAKAWNQFLLATQTQNYSNASINLPRARGQPIEIRYLDGRPAHERASNLLTLETASGAILKHERYADKSAGAQLMASIFALHSGRFFGLGGTLFFMLASLAMPLFAITGWMLYLQRRKRKQRSRSVASPVISMEN